MLRIITQKHFCLRLTATLHVYILVSLGIAKHYQNISNCDKSMKLGRMVHIDLLNKFSPVAKMNYGYVGQGSRSK